MPQYAEEFFIGNDGVSLEMLHKMASVYIWTYEMRLKPSQKSLSYFEYCIT